VQGSILKTYETESVVKAAFFKFV